MGAMFLTLAYFLLFGAIARTFWSHRQAQRRQDQLVHELRGTPHWVRIIIRQPAHAARLFVLVPYEVRGLLVDEGNAVRVLGETRRGERIDHRYPKDRMNLRWLGNARISDMNLHWIGIGEGAEALRISADTGLSAVPSRSATADIVRRLAPGMELPPVARAEFALEKNRRSMIAVIAFFALAGFALIDGVIVNDNALLNGKAVMSIAPFFGLLAIGCYPLLTRGGVPSRESVALSVLLCCGLAFAFVPLAKRADQWASGNATRTVVYRLQEKARFIPVEGAAPEINYGRYREYWDQFQPGSTHEFQLFHGPFGLWQLEETDLRRRLRAFYQKAQ